MNKTEIFQVLGIEETKDENLIKRAYREKLAVTNPEDNPEGFKRLRSAYEEACKFARQPEEEVKEEKDESPSGYWVEKVSEVYANMEKRRDIACWEALFEEDVLLDLAEEENCTYKLLRFLMEHFKLPTAVWKLIQEKLHIIESSDNFREYFPADFMNFVVNRCRHGEDLEFDQFKGAPDADYDLFIRYSDNCWEALNNDQIEQAAEFVKNADDLGITHPIMEINRAKVWELQGKKEEAAEWVKNLYKEWPQDLMVRFHTAELLWRNDYQEDAVPIYEAIKENNEKHYMANRRLMEWYYEQKRFKDAKKCAEEVLSLGGEEELRDLLTLINAELEKELEEKFRETPDITTGLELGWCYLQDSRFCEGIQHAIDLKPLVTSEKDAEYKGLMTKLYVEGAEYEKALEMAAVWEEALKTKIASYKDEETDKEKKKDQDRVKQSISIRAYCYGKLGYRNAEYFKKAIEYIEIVEDMAEADKPDYNILLEKAQIYLDMEEYEKSLQVSRELIEKYQIFAAYASAQKAYNRMWDAQGVLDTGYQCIRHFPEYPKAYERIAKVYLDFEKNEDLQTLLEQAKQQGVKSLYLDAYAYRAEHEIPEEEVFDKKLEEFRKEYSTKVGEGELEYYEKGLPLLTELFYWYPGAYMLVELALFHKSAGEYDKAIEVCEKALEDEPGNPYVWNAMAYCYRMKGDYEQALISVRKAKLYFDREYPRSFADMGDIYSLMGDYNRALEAYQEVLRVGDETIRESKYFMRRYAYVLAKNGRLDEIEKVIGNAYDDIYERCEELASIYYGAGASEQVDAVLRLWAKNLKLKKKNLTITKRHGLYYEAMAWTELVFGEKQKALEYFEQAIDILECGGDVAGIYCDMAFASALCGDDERGKKYAAKLRRFLRKEQEKGGCPYHEMDKIKLEREFISQYYTAGAEDLEAILAKEETAHTCYFCTYCLCKELEGMRILQMLRMGKTKEALARVESNLQKQPVDEFMLAIKHVCESGVPVVPYSVNGCSDSDTGK